MDIALARAVYGDAGRRILTHVAEDFLRFAIVGMPNVVTSAPEREIPGWYHAVLRARVSAAIGVDRTDFTLRKALTDRNCRALYPFRTYAADCRRVGRCLGRGHVLVASQCIIGPTRDAYFTLHIGRTDSGFEWPRSGIIIVGYGCRQAATASGEQADNQSVTED